MAGLNEPREDEEVHRDPQAGGGSNGDGAAPPAGVSGGGIGRKAAIVAKAATFWQRWQRWQCFRVGPERGEKLANVGEPVREIEVVPRRRMPPPNPPEPKRERVVPGPSPKRRKRE